jgi:short-subunit dehydrogenase
MTDKFREWSGKTALITGASSGIGAATARELSRRGMQVVLTARRQERLQSLVDEIHQAGGHAHAIPADLCEPDQRREIAAQAYNGADAPDILVNNAGLGWYGYFSEMRWETAYKILALNITAVTHLTNLFLPVMIRRGYGHIINVGSISGSLPEQGIAMYGASKAFLDAFTTSLHRELQGSGVHVSVVRAGPVRSEFYQTAKDLPRGRPVPAERFAVSCERVARRIAGLLTRPRKVIYVPAVLNLAPWLEMFFGSLIDRLGPLLLNRQSS